MVLALAVCAHSHERKLPDSYLFRLAQSESSMMTFEGKQFQGSANILQQLRSIGPVSHSFATTDVQPSSTPSSILIFVTGSIKIGGDNPLHFSQLFQLVATGPGAYYVHNSIFRLNYGLP
jgi:hypothetical protein